MVNMKNIVVTFLLLAQLSLGLQQSSFHTYYVPDDFLNTAVRAFEPPQLDQLNLYRGSDSLQPSQCGGGNIIHLAVGKCKDTLSDVFIIPHAAIYHDGQRCGTNKSTDYLLIVPGLHLRTAIVANDKGIGPLYDIVQKNPRAANALNVLQDLDPVHVGIEYGTARVCGGEVKFPEKSVYLFINTPPGSRDLNFGFAYLGVSELGMITIKPDQQICLYKETRKLGPGQAIFATPSPSPVGLVTEIPDVVFTNLSDPVQLDACFPATKVTSTPFPVQTPTASVTPIVTPNPTGNVTQTPVPSGTVGPTPVTATITPTPSSGTVIPTPTASPTPSQSSSDSGVTTPKPTPTGSTTTVTKTPDPSQSPKDENPNDDGSVCFPSDATVNLENGKELPISELGVGDKVLVDGNKFSEVFLFTHHTKDIRSRFVRLILSSGKSITLSPGHYIPASGRIKTASSVRIGDKITLGDGRSDRVVSTTMITATGLHNPQTLDGTIVVNGIVASTFTKHVRYTTALSLLAPVKFFYRMNILRILLGYMLKDGNDYIVSLLPNGEAVL